MNAALQREKGGVVPTIRRLSEAIKAKDNLLTHFRKRLGLLGEDGAAGTGNGAESAFKPKNAPAAVPMNDGFGEEGADVLDADGEKAEKMGDVGDTYFSPAGKNVHAQSAVTKRDLRMAEDEISRLQYLDRHSGGSTQKFAE